MEKDATTGHRRHRPGTVAPPSGVAAGHLKGTSEAVEFQRSRSMGGLHQKGDPPNCIQKLCKELESEDQGKDLKSNTEDTICQVNLEEDKQEKNQGALGKLDHESGKLDHENVELDHESGKLDHESGKLDHESIELDHESGKLDHESGKLDHESIELDHESGKLDHESGKLDHESIELDHESGKLDHESGKLDHESGKLDHESGKLDHESGKLDHESGKLDHESGKLDHESGKLDHESGKLDHESGKLDHESVKLEPEVVKSYSEASDQEEHEDDKGTDKCIQEAKVQELKPMKLEDLLEKEKPSMFVEIDLGDHAEEVVTCAMREEKRPQMDMGDLSEDETKTSWVCCIPYSTRKKVKESV